VADQAAIDVVVAADSVAVVNVVATVANAAAAGLATNNPVPSHHGYLAPGFAWNYHLSFLREKEQGYFLPIFISRGISIKHYELLKKHLRYLSPLALEPHAER
jgi:hypothetical protein